MNSTPILLTDKNLLKDIFILRVTAHENSGNAHLINKSLFPNGWFDNLEENALHWIILNEHQDIIASARLNILEDIKDIEYHKVFTKFNIPPTKPFGFLSRLVIHPDYRKRGFAKMLDQVRLEYLKSHKIPFALITVQDIRAKSLIKYGFKLLGIEDVQFSQEMQPDREHVFIVFPETVKLPL